MRSRRICVIGAGPCGVTTVKNLLQVGFENVVCYDDGTGLGGNWRYDERPERSTVYHSAHLISSKSLSQFEDFPMPDDYPDFPSHKQMLAYFESYAQHFGADKAMRFGATVEKATLEPDGSWSVRVRVDGSSTETRFDDLFVCSGHHREPFIPDVPGAFSGKILHSRDFKRPDAFAGQRVLVVGGGNSACDIAVDISRHAETTALSFRRGYYIVPKVLFGRPIDILYTRLRRKLPLPRKLFEKVLGAFLRIGVGPYDKYGLPTPSGGPLHTHPTLNTAVLTALRDGMVLPRGPIARFDGGTVEFQSGIREAFDTILWATGFNSSFPFLDKTLIDWRLEETPRLYLKMMHPRVPSLFFIGLFQPIGCIWRMADHQARIAALTIAGKLPRPVDLDRRVGEEIAAAKRDFDASRRHAVEVDGFDFTRRLKAELELAQ